MADIKTLLARASHAVCGFSEKEVYVPTKKVKQTVATLRREGFYVVGKSLNTGSKFQKVWFVRGGSL